MVINNSLSCQELDNVNFTTSVDYTQIGNWSESKSTYDWENVNKSNMIIKFDKYTISISNPGLSTYILYKTISKGENYVTWDAMDNNSIKCNVSVKFEDNYGLLTVIYSDYCARFFFSPK
jgi:hypothetical protein